MTTSGVRRVLKSLEVAVGRSDRRAAFSLLRAVPRQIDGTVPPGWTGIWHNEVVLLHDYWGLKDRSAMLREIELADMTLDCIDAEARRAARPRMHPALVKLAAELHAEGIIIDQQEGYR